MNSIKQNCKLKTQIVFLLMCVLLVLIINGNEVFSSTLEDSGINYSDALESVPRNDYLSTGSNYNEMDALYMNPSRGFFSWAAGLHLFLDDSKNVVKSPKSNNSSLVYLSVDIHDFSGAYHLESNGDRGIDYELTDSALDTLDRTLQNIKNNNNQVILRIVYDKNSDGIQSNEGYIYYENGTKKQIVEPRQEMILKHLEQLGPILKNNKDVIYTIQLGLYGSYGELHSSAMCTNANIKSALSKFLEVTRDTDISISVRTPSRYAQYLDINVSDIENYPSSIGDDAYRIAIFNDGYLGTHNDWGTFVNREKEVNWLSKQNMHNPYGGQAILDTHNEVDDVAKHDNVIYEMPKTHTSYLDYTWRQQLHNYWASTPYSGEDLEYKNTNLFKYIEYHLGYRFVIRDSKLTKKVEKGSSLTNNFTIENVGFGNLLSKVKSYAYITDLNDNKVLEKELQINPLNYNTKTRTNDSIDVGIPESLASGDYKLYLQFVIDKTDDNKLYGAIRFANENVWSSTLGANYLGSFEVVDKNEPTKYTLTFNVNGGTDIPPITKNAGEKIILPTPVREGYKFVEWLASDNKKNPVKEYFEGEEISFDQDLTLLAIWENGSNTLKVIEGNNQSYILGSNTDIRIKTNGELSNLEVIKVDNNVLDTANYDLATGSTILTLKSEYLDTLSVGEHTVQFVYNDGNVSTKLSVLNEDNSIIKSTKNLQTGDKIIIYIIMLLLSFAGATGIVFYLRKTKVQK